MNKSIILDAPARIHLGFLELNHLADRNFGSLGLTISKFRNILKIEDYHEFSIDIGKIEIKKKVKDVFKKIASIKNLKKCKLTILQNIPEHSGLGSGTQLSLATGFLLSEFNGLNLKIDEISNLLGRGLRSGIGIQSFKTGGFIIDSGKIRGSNSIPLTIFRNQWPREWKLILIFDMERSGVHGKEELKKFKKLKKVDSSLVNENCGVVLMKIIPSIIEKNFQHFSTGVQIIQDNMSKIFYGDKKDQFASNKIQMIFNFLRNKKIEGFGYSSWGPTGFIFCKNSNRRNQLCYELEKYIKFNRIGGVSIDKIEGRNVGSKKRKNF